MKFFLTEGPGTFDAEWRAWLARHPGAMWTGRIIVLTVAVLVAVPVAVIVLPLLPLWLFVVVGLWSCLNYRDRQRAHRDRQHRELLAAIRNRPARS